MIPTIDVPLTASTSVVVSSQSLHPLRRFLTTIAGSQDEEDYEDDEEGEEEEAGGEEDDDEENDEKFKHRIANSKRSMSSNQNKPELNSSRIEQNIYIPRLIEKSVIIHKDENGFGLRVAGQSPVFVEHVHENGAAWRAGVRSLDQISKVNGAPIAGLDHTEVVLMFKSSNRFIGLTLLTSELEKETPDENGSRRQSYSSLKKPMKNSGSSFKSLHHQIRTSHVRSSSGSFSYLERQNGSQHGRDIKSVLGVNLTNKPATRSESISATNPKPLSTFKQQLSSATNQTTPEQNSGSYSSPLEDNQLTTICVSCQAPIGRSKTLSNYERQPLTCIECQLNHLSASCQTKASSHHQRATYGSLRDQKQQPPQHVQIRVSSQESKQVEERVESTASYMKLSRSVNNISSAIAVTPYQQTLTVKLMNEGKQSESNSTMQTTIVKRPPVTNKRLEIIKEFIDTEKTHTDRLRCLDELFYRPLKLGGYMTAEQLRMVFSCHRTLYKIHRQIHRTLLSASYNLCAEPMIGSALLEIFEGELKRRLERAACTFCAAQSTNVDLLNKLTRRDTKVGDFIAQLSQQMVGRLGVKDLLASCFQRLTKYPLLLESLLKATPTNIPPLANEENGEKEIGQVEIEKRILVDGASTLRKEEEEEESTRTSRRMLAIGLAEEREFIERALHQSRQILVKVNESVKVATSNCKLKEIWKRTDKYPGVPLVDISKQQVVHEGQLTLRLSKRSFDVHVLLLTDYLIILSREGQDKYRLKFFTPDGKSSSSSSCSQGLVYSPIFIVDEHLSTRDAATDENGFYLLCKRKDDSRIYEFASRSPAERHKWRDRIQATIEHQMNRANRRPSCESTITKSSSEISAKQDTDEGLEVPFKSSDYPTQTSNNNNNNNNPESVPNVSHSSSSNNSKQLTDAQLVKEGELTKVEGTISYVEDDGIVLPSKLEFSQVFVDQAEQVTLLSLNHF